MLSDSTPMLKKNPRIEWMVTTRLTRAELTPVRWVGTIDRTQLAASFSRDSVFGALQNYAGRSSFASCSSSRNAGTRSV